MGSSAWMLTTFRSLAWKKNELEKCWTAEIHDQVAKPARRLRHAIAVYGNFESLSLLT